ncbi:hypothetical protein MRX96_022644 [Rhipicephalus microplus]
MSQRSDTDLAALCRQRMGEDPHFAALLSGLPPPAATDGPPMDGVATMDVDRLLELNAFGADSFCNFVTFDNGVDNEELPDEEATAMIRGRCEMSSDNNSEHEGESPTVRLTPQKAGETCSKCDSKKMLCHDW